MTKKEPIGEGDMSHQEEQTIVLTEKEFLELSNTDGKKIHKTRYDYDYNGRKAEIGVFQGDLKGLVLVDFEFDSVEEKDDFGIPDFCLAEVTQELFAAGGMLCGKSYEDIAKHLEGLGYRKIS